MVSAGGGPRGAGNPWTTNDSGKTGRPPPGPIVAVGAAAPAALTRPVVWAAGMGSPSESTSPRPGDAGGITAGCGPAAIGGKATLSGETMRFVSRDFRKQHARKTTTGPQRQPTTAAITTTQTAGRDTRKRPSLSAVVLAVVGLAVVERSG